MPEIAKFVSVSSQRITPALAERVIHELPLWKVQFVQIDSSTYPHLSHQLEFLSEAVEDSVEGNYKQLPYSAVAEAIFALVYCHKMLEILPHSEVELAHCDDSRVVQSVLVRHEPYWKAYAESRKLVWSRITTKP